MTIFDCYKKRHQYFDRRLDIIANTPGHALDAINDCIHNMHRISGEVIRLPLKYLNIELGEIEESALYGDLTAFYEYIAECYARRIEQC